MLSLLALLTFLACGTENTAPRTPPNVPPTSTDATVFAKGADISWYTEMKADGRKFYNVRGEERECPVLMKELGMNAIRLRVWVNPENKGSNYCNTTDVVTKAKAARQAGMEVMIDFHYSDWWADPSRQDIPQSWTNHSFAELQQDVKRHTAEVLTALKHAGVAPQWVQIGNETNNGMLGEMGTTMKPQQYAALFRSGYEAAKSVFPTTKVIVHLARGFDSGLFKWNLDLLKNNGATFDLVGMSVYPSEYRYWENGKETNTRFWSETERTNVTLSSPDDLVEKAFANIDFIAQRYGCKVMIVETGMPRSTPTASAAIMRKILSQARNNKDCAGVFYWEPQTDGVWRPASYASFNWNAYDMGAFTSEGHATETLAPFGE